MAAVAQLPGQTGRSRPQPDDRQQLVGGGIEGRCETGADRLDVGGCGAERPW
jgi:hypothetical protein